MKITALKTSSTRPLGSCLKTPGEPRADDRRHFRLCQLPGANLSLLYCQLHILLVIYTNLQH